MRPSQSKHGPVAARVIFALLLGSTAVLSGCHTAAAMGAVVGTVGGAAVGGATAGARATGAVVGAAGGAIVGAAVDRGGNAGKCFERGVEVPCPPE